MNNIFITGEMGIGKSTSIEKILNLLNKNYNIGGYKCLRNKKIKDDKILLTYFISSLSTSSTFKIIENNIIDKKDNVKIYSESFDDFSLILEKDLEESDFIILDEIGFAESNSKKYLEILEKVLNSDKVVLGVLKKHNCNLIQNIKNREDSMVFEIDENNRDFLYKEIYNVIIKKL